MFAVVSKAEDIEPDSANDLFGSSAVSSLKIPGKDPSGQCMLWVGGRNMTDGDIQFLKSAGIEPSGLEDPFPTSLTTPPPAETPTPKLTEEDASWLQNLRVTWEHEPEPEFIPPKTLREYLGRFPNGINEATRAVANEMELDLSEYDFDDLAQDIVVMFLDFSTDLEDVVAMYPFHQPVRPGGCSSAQFHDYIRMRVAACVPVVLGNDPTGTDALGESLGS
jgi:hypothetical protein